MRPREILTVLNSLRRSLLSEDEPTRLRARFGLVHRLASAWGFEVYTTDLTWLNDPGFWQVWREAPGWRAHRADRKFVVYSLARSVSQIAGDTAECGVLEGGSSFIICSVLGKQGARRHHAFDSFEGLSAPSREDRPRVVTSFEWARGDLAVPLERVKRNLERFDFVEYHPGWIPDRFVDVADARFAFVHVDVDLYQPTRDSVAFFYERLVAGGVLLCDDYGHATCPGARQALDEHVARSGANLVELPTGQAYVIKR